MATVLTQALPAAVPAPMSSPVSSPQDLAERVVLHGIRWQTYEMLATDVAGSRLHMTYDRGDLELMVVSCEHERYKSLLRYVVQVLAEELNVDYIDAGSTTMKREDVGGAIESDNCFYFRHYPQVRGKKEIDLRADPPPDLGLEIDVTRSSLNRMSIYSALRIPEVWRFDGATLLVYILRESGEYEQVAESPTYPGVRLADLPALIRAGLEMTYLEFVRSVRDWVRREVLPRWNRPKTGQ